MQRVNHRNEGSFEDGFTEIAVNRFRVKESYKYGQNEKRQGEGL